MQSVLDDAAVAASIQQVQGLTVQQLQVRVACELELIEWRERQIEHLQDELAACRERLYAAAAVLACKQEGQP